MKILYITVGGIYTVLRSKAFISTEELGNQYVAFGPYKEHSAKTEVEESEFPENSPLYKVVNIMRSRGHTVRISNWRKNMESLIDYVYRVSGETALKLDTFR